MTAFQCVGNCIRKKEIFIQFHACFKLVSGMYKTVWFVLNRTHSFTFSLSRSFRGFWVCQNTFSSTINHNSSLLLPSSIKPRGNTNRNRVRSSSKQQLVSLSLNRLEKPAVENVRGDFDLLSKEGERGFFFSHEIKKKHSRSSFIQKTTANSKCLKSQFK